MILRGSVIHNKRYYHPRRHIKNLEKDVTRSAAAAVQNAAKYTHPEHQIRVILRMEDVMKRPINLNCVIVIVA